MGTFSFLCSIAYIGQVLCYTVKFLDYICMILEFISDSIIGTVKHSNQLI